MIGSTHPTLVVILLCVACGAPPTDGPTVASVPVDGGAIRFNLSEVSAESRECAESDARCARVDLRSLETIDGGTKSVRENIDLFMSDDLVSRMRSYLPEEVGNGLNDVERLAGAFLAEHQGFLADFPDASAEWFIEITATPIYNTPEVATIDIAESAYTGGAHPNSHRRLVSFDVATGALLGVEDLTTDVAGLSSLVERQLRADRGLDADDDLGTAGFWFPEEGFTLPDNVGVVPEGLRFHWDAYEIAPYSMGVIDVMVPSGELTGIVDRSFW